MNIKQIQKAISVEGLDGWLFFNFRHRDTAADRILGIPSDRMNSRPWYYLVPASGTPLKIMHSVEPESISFLPGNETVYKSRDNLMQIISAFKGRWGAQFSEDITAVSTLDYGTARFIESTGIVLCSSERLIQRTCSLLDSGMIDSHEKAADNLYRIVEDVWDRLSCGMKNGKRFSETEVQQWILSSIADCGMITEHMPIVASAAGSGNPHYAPEEHNNPILPDSPLQFDLWAKYPGENDVWADISWVGFTGLQPDPAFSAIFGAVISARNRCLEFIDSRLSSAASVTGFDADMEARKILEEAGYGEYIFHRTGHGIDTDLHGSGVNLDSVEFPDRREIIEGSCFSIEPGLYTKDWGCRTEIDVYIKNGKPVVSGRKPQEKLLRF